MARPSFSIVMPTYQRRDVVSDAVRALARLRYDGPLEALVVVDGSTDGTAAALAEIAVPFPFRVVTQANGGAASARNIGARAATGEVLLFLDDDMMVDPDIVEQHARSHLAGADAVLGDIPLEAGSRAGFLSAGVGAWVEERRQRLVESGELMLFDLLTGQLSIRRAVFDSIGGFDAARFTRGGSFGNEDLDIGVRLLGGYRVDFNPAAISRQRYVVGYEANLRQWFQAGQADVAFARKHPRHAKALFDLRDGLELATRRIFIPLSRIPGLARGLGRVAAWLADRTGDRGGWAAGSVAWLFFLARDLLYWRGVHLAGGIPANHPLLVLCYHAIADLSGDPVLGSYAVPPAQFERQIDGLLRRGYRFVAPGEVARHLRREAGLPRRPVLLTFDDCYVDLLDVAAPALAARGIEAVAFAVTGLATATNEWDHRLGRTRLALLDADGLRALAREGVEIGAHSRTHRALPEVPGAELVAETAGSAEDVAALALPLPRFFAYPYGEEDGATRAAVRAAGYLAGFGLAARRFVRGMDPMAMPRVEVLRQDDGLVFRLKTRWPRLAALL